MYKNLKPHVNHCYYTCSYNKCMGQINLITITPVVSALLVKSITTIIQNYIIIPQIRSSSGNGASHEQITNVHVQNVASTIFYHINHLSISKRVIMICIPGKFISSEPPISANRDFSFTGISSSCILLTNSNLY